MTDNDGWKVQASYKHGNHEQHMLNVRGDDAMDLKSQLNDLAAHDVLETIVSTGSLLSAVEVALNTLQPVPPPAAVAPPVPAAVPDDPWANQQPPAWTQPQPEPATAAPVGQHTCVHGARQFKSGTSARGAWQAWMCPTSKGDPTKCQPEWV